MAKRMWNCWKCGLPCEAYRGTASGRDGWRVDVMRSRCCRVQVKPITEDSDASIPD